jgi:Contractile injection system tube protein
LTLQTGRNVHTDFVDNLMKLTLVQDLDGDAAKRRPPKVAVKWGKSRFPEFQGVIESVSTKYTMFLPDGTPVRAVCHVTIKEAGSVSFRKGRVTARPK